jgi:hypothetical protein
MTKRSKHVPIRVCGLELGSTRGSKELTPKRPSGCSVRVPFIFCILKNYEHKTIEQKATTRWCLLTHGARPDKIHNAATNFYRWAKTTENFLTKHLAGLPQPRKKGKIADKKTR